MPELEGKRVLVTGGSGFVGLPTVRALLDRGAEVRVLDKELERVAGLDCELVAGDIGDAETVARACEGVDAVVHLAVLPLTAANAEVQVAYDVNVTGCFNVFRAAGESGVQRVVFASASSAYGPTSVVPIPDDHPLRPVAFYPASKAAGEMLLHGLAGTYGYGFMILRYMNVYGPGQRAGVVPAVARALLAGERPTLTGDGNQAFDFVHIDDCAQANMLAVESDRSGDSLNVGSGEAASLNDVVATMNDLLGSGIEPAYTGEVTSSPPRVGDVTTARELVGYRPTVSLQDGLASVLDELREGAVVASGRD